MTNTRRQVQTPGKPAEQAQPEVATPEIVANTETSQESPQTVVVEQPVSTAEQAQVDEPPMEGEKPDLAALLPAILESLHRIEEHLANGSQVEPAKSKPKKGRFKFIEGKGHVWVEG